jgi:lysophospholipase L1-like esterase
MRRVSLKVAGRAAALVVALVAIDVAARPFVPLPRKSTLFVRDPELGWRLRPSAQDLWDGVPVEVNAKGLRGPELDYARRPGVARILYLGDSVTVGYLLPSHAQSYPYLTAERLQRMGGRTIETVNGAVNGYSTWQEVRWLEREGLGYQPDLIVLGFVLNDVAGELEALRGWRHTASKQLALSVSSGIDRIANYSALAALARQAALTLRFGRNVRGGAEREELFGVRMLVADPERPDVREAWAVTRGDLDRLATLCRRRHIRLCLVVFPYAFQVGVARGGDDPQRRLLEFGRQLGIPALDLLPVLRARAKDDGLAPADYFLDDDHPSLLGSAVVADVLADFIVAQRLLPDLP